MGAAFGGAGAPGTTSMRMIRGSFDSTLFGSAAGGGAAIGGVIETAGGAGAGNWVFAGQGVNITAVGLTGTAITHVATG